MKRSSVQAYLTVAGLVLGIGAMPLAAAPQQGWGDAAKFTATLESEVDHTQNKPLSVTTDNGGVKVIKGTGDKVRVAAKVRATTQERLDATKVITTRNADGTLSVSVQWPGGGRKGSEGCDLEVQAPDIASLNATTSNGSITAKNLSGPATLGTSNGAITVDTWDGNVRADSSNGSIDLSGVSGTVDASSSNGRVRAADVLGPVKVKTSNASVDVSLRGTSTGPVTIETNNGSVHLKVGRAFIGKLHAQTSNGSIKVNAPTGKPVGKPARDEGTWQFGEGGSASEVETDNGSVTVDVVESGD